MICCRASSSENIEGTKEDKSMNNSTSAKFVDFGLDFSENMKSSKISAKMLRHETFLLITRIFFSFFGWRKIRAFACAEFFFFLIFWCQMLSFQLEILFSMMNTGSASARGARES